MLYIESAGVTTVQAVLVTSSDPTGTPPAWSLTATERNDPGTWENGSWGADGWNMKTGRVTAKSPTLGGVGAAIDLVEGTTYDAWVKWTVGAETPVHRAGSIEAR